MQLLLSLNGRCCCRCCCPEAGAARRCCAAGMLLQAAAVAHPQSASAHQTTALHAAAATCSAGAPATGDSVNRVWCQQLLHVLLLLLLQSYEPASLLWLLQRDLLPAATSGGRAGMGNSRGHACTACSWAGFGMGTLSMPAAGRLCPGPATAVGFQGGLLQPSSVGQRLRTRC